MYIINFSSRKIAGVQSLSKKTHNILLLNGKRTLKVFSSCCLAFDGVVLKVSAYKVSWKPLQFTAAKDESSIIKKNFIIGSNGRLSLLLKDARLNLSIFLTALQKFHTHTYIQCIAYAHFVAYEWHFH